MSDIRPVNFAPGPAIIATEVLEEAARAVVALPRLGLSILEISHRSPYFERVLFDTRDKLRRLMGVPDTHEILFLQGGARGQFAQIPLSFLPSSKRAAYIDTGAWSTYALEEGQTVGDAWSAASSKDDGYRHLPDVSDLRFDDDVAYVHTTSNNTIYGTQWQTLPDFGDTPHVCDMSSDVLSRPVDVSRFALLYSGAQKNAGPAGVTIVVVHKGFMESGRADIPRIWQYRIQAANDSMFNTPPTFAIYMVGLVCDWLEAQGGVEGITRRNEEKAALIYDALDADGDFYRGYVTDPAHRSRMNVTWRLPNETLEKTFVAEAAAKGLSGLKGHRLAGGVRASIYNQLPVEGVERLVEFMRAFRPKS